MWKYIYILQIFNNIFKISPPFDELLICNEMKSFIEALFGSSKVTNSESHISAFNHAHTLSTCSTDDSTRFILKISGMILFNSVHLETNK